MVKKHLLVETLFSNAVFQTVDVDSLVGREINLMGHDQHFKKFE